MTLSFIRGAERWARRLTLLVFLVPLLPVPPVLFPMVFGRGLLIAGFALAATVALVVSRSGRNAIPAPPSRVTIFGAAYLAVAGVSAFLAPDRTLAFWSEQGRMDGVAAIAVAGALYLLIRGLFLTDRERSTLLTTIILTGTGVACIGILQWFFPGMRALYGASGERASGTLGNPILLASYLAPIAALAASRVFERGVSLLRRAIFSVCTAIIVLAVVLTQSKGGTLALGVAALAGFAVVAFRSTHRAGRFWSRAALVLGLAAILWIGFGLPGTSSLPASVRALREWNSGATTLSTRLIHWRTAIQGFRDRPVFGYGPEGYRYAFTNHYPPELLKYSFAETLSDKPHNLFLEILVETGAVGFIIFFALLGAALFGAIRLARTDPARGAGLLAAIMAYSVAVFFSFDSPALLALLACILALSSPPKSETAVGDAPPFPIASAAVGFIALAIMVVPFFSAIPASIETAAAVDAAAGRAPATLEQSFTRAVEGRGVFEKENLQHLARWINISAARGSLPAATITVALSRVLPRLGEITATPPQSFLTTFMYGQLLMLRGEIENSAADLTAAEAALREAGSLAPGHQSVAVALGRLYLLKGDPSGAVAALRLAVTAAPDVADAHWYLGLALVANNERSAGLMEIDAARNLGRQAKSTRERLYVIDLYAEAKRFDDVATLYREIIADDPDEPKWHTQLAATYAKLGETELAISEVERAIDLDPRLRDSAREFLRQFGIELP